MDEDSGKPAKVRATRRAHKHKTRKSPSLSSEPPSRPVEDAEREVGLQGNSEYIRKHSDDEPTDDSKMEPKDHRQDLAHHEDAGKNFTPECDTEGATGREIRRAYKRALKKNKGSTDSGLKENGEVRTALSGHRTPPNPNDEIHDSGVRTKDLNDTDDPPSGNRPVEPVKQEIEGPGSVVETLGETAARLNNMLKVHHMKKTSPGPSPEETPGRTRPLRQPKHDLQDDTPKAPTQTTERAKSSKNPKTKDKLPSAESFLTELDAPTSDPVQPPIIRLYQHAPVVLSKSSQSLSTTSSDRKVSFNLDRNLLQHCSANRPQNNFYGKPNQKRKQELRNIAYSSRSENAKKEGALDFDPKEKSNQQTRRATKKAARTKRVPATGKQGRSGKISSTGATRTRKTIQGKGNIFITSCADDRFLNNDDPETNEFTQMLTKATNSCKIN